VALLSPTNQEDMMVRPIMNGIPADILDNACCPYHTAKKILPYFKDTIKEMQGHDDLQNGIFACPVPLMAAFVEIANMFVIFHDVTAKHEEGIRHEALQIVAFVTALKREDMSKVQLEGIPELLQDFQNLADVIVKKASNTAVDEPEPPGVVH
jgi:hypothetical protein